ncbi:hypothetical protein Trydic_g17998 [Trypoxylus dichotomus]
MIRSPLKGNANNNRNTLNTNLFRLFPRLSVLSVSSPPLARKIESPPLLPIDSRFTFKLLRIRTQIRRRRSVEIKRVTPAIRRYRLSGSGETDKIRQLDSADLVVLRFAASTLGFRNLRRCFTSQTRTALTVTVLSDADTSLRASGRDLGFMIRA